MNRIVWKPRRALVALIAVTALLRIAWAAALGPGNDEAYYVQYARHADFSYHDHPPMVAWMVGTGLRVFSGLPIVLATRLPFVLLFAGSTWLMYRLAAQFFGPWAGVLAAFILNVAGYFPLAAGAFALPDGPLVFFWLATFCALRWAIASGGRAWPWVVVGLAWGGALLSKYHAAFLPVGFFLFLVLEPHGRVWLRRPGPYLALALGLLIASPVLGWNAAHGWDSFAFHGARAVGSSSLPRIDRLLPVLGGQVAYAFPWVWCVLAMAAVGVLRDRNRATGERFFVCAAVVPLAAFCLVGLWRPVLPHWSLIGLVPLMPIAAARMGAWARVRPTRFRVRVVGWCGALLAVAVVIAVQVNHGVFQRKGPIPLAGMAPAADPSLDLYGWGQVAAEIEKRGLLSANTHLFTSKWYHSSQLGFQLPGGLAVHCYSGRAPLGFAHWGQAEEWVGRDGILAVVNHSSTEPAAFERWFERIEPLGEVMVERAGVRAKVVRLYRCVRQTAPFPLVGGGKAADAPLDPARVALRREPSESAALRR